MRIWGIIALVAGVIVMGYALALETSIDTGTASYSAYPLATPGLPSQVSNLSLLQRQLIWFISGGIIGLAGVVMLCAATILDAVARRPVAITATPGVVMETAAPLSNFAEPAEWTPPADDGKNDLLTMGIAFAGFVVLVVIFIIFARH